MELEPSTLVDELLDQIRILPIFNPVEFGCPLLAQPMLFFQFKSNLFAELIV